MSNPWIAFFAGCFIGCMGGMSVLSLCIIAGQADRDIELLQPNRTLGKESKP